MSIESIGGVNNIIPPEVINPASKPEPVVEPNEKEKQVAEPKPASNTEPGLSTKDFMTLRTQSSDGDYAVLDEVIAKMKENISELGDALEGMLEKTQKVAKMAIGLQLLKATFEAIDKIRQGPGGGDS